MKKIIALALVRAMTLSVMTGCSSSDSSGSDSVSGSDSQTSQSAQTQNPTDKSCADVLAAISGAAALTEPKEIGRDYMDFLGISADMYQDFAGYYVSPGIDIVLVVKAAEGKTGDISAKLKDRCTEISAEQSNYDKTLSDKAGAGRVVTKGDFVVLAIAGDNDKFAREGADAAYADIDKAIDEALG